MFAVEFLSDNIIFLMFCPHVVFLVKNKKNIRVNSRYKVKKTSIQQTLQM